MKKVFSVMLMFIMCFTMISPVRALADTKYLTRKTIENVNVDKVFEIEFTKELDPDTVNNGYIKIVTDDKKQEQVGIMVKVDPKNPKKVLITPGYRYTQGKRYKITIPAGIMSKDGEMLGVGYIQPFTVKNFYAGLPVDGGIIIIGNQAYHIDYISKNSSKRNEIIKGNYKVFYVDEKSKGKIKDVIGGNFVDGTNLPPGYNFRKPLFYTDADGVVSRYMWDSDVSEFRKVIPKVELKVTVNSHNLADKVLMVKVKQMLGLDGVMYYKLDSSNTYYSITEPFIFSSKSPRETITFYSSSMTKLAEANINTIVEGVYTRKLKMFDEKPDGNSAGNIINNGYAAANADGYILYNNSGDGDRLYKNDINAMFNNVIGDDNAQYINVSDEWVYYSNYSDKGKLYRMKLDGSLKEKLNDDYSAFVTLMGEYIYYTDFTNGGRITKIKKDGSDAFTDEKGYKHGWVLSDEVKDKAYFINIVGDWIYYSNISDHHRVYAINRSGTYRIRLSDEGASSIQVVDDWVYYTDNKGKLKKVKKDGTKETEELGGVVAKFDRGYFFNVVDDWIYYSNAEDEDRLYKIKTDGTENMRLTREKASYINVVHNTIYFVSGKTVYTVPTSTTGGTRPVALTKVQTDKKIVQVDDQKKIVDFADVNMDMDKLEQKYLPARVPGILSDNRINDFVVQWDTKNVRIQNGIRYYKGKLIGYDQFIECQLIIPSEMLNESTTIAIYNNSGKASGYIEVYSLPIKDEDANNPPKLAEGDVVTIYTDKALEKVMRSAVVKRDGEYNKAVFTNLDLDKYGSQEYYFSIQRDGKYRSKGTEVVLAEVPIITNSIRKPVRDIDDEGLGIDGRDFFIEEMRNSRNKGIIATELYIGTGNRLSLEDGKALPFDEKINGEWKSGDPVDTGEVKGDWQGGEYTDKNKGELSDPTTIDSFGYKMTSTQYSIFLVNKYNDLGTPDNRGQGPLIKGWAISEGARINVTPEGIPNKPTLQTQTKKYGDTIQLGYTPKAGEQAFLIPVWNDKFRDADKKIFGYEKFLLDDKNENESNVGVYDSENWLDQARHWLKEDEPWPFDEEHPAINERIITRLDGDGRVNTMPVPKGVLWNKVREQEYEEKMDNIKSFPADIKTKINTKYGIDIDSMSDDELRPIKDKLIDELDRYYAPDIEYKLVIKNEVGVSFVSDGVLTIDNKPPVVVREYHEDKHGDEISRTKIVAGEFIQILSRFERATIYLTYSEDYLDTIQELEEAIGVGRVQKYSVIAGAKDQIYTDNIKPRLMDGRYRFLDGGIDEPKKGYIKIGVADEVGNIRFVEGTHENSSGKKEKGMYVYVDNAELQNVYRAAINAKNTAREKGFVFSSNIDEVNLLIDQIESMERNIESRDIRVTVTQAEVDRLVLNAKTKLVQLGIPYTGVKDKNALMANYLKSLRTFDSKDVAVDLDNVRDDIYLPSKLEYEGELIGNINWTVTSGDSELWFSMDEAGERGDVKIPIIPNPADHLITLRANYEPNGGTSGNITYNMTIKPKKFNVITDYSDNQFAIIFKKDVYVGDKSDITAEIWDPVNRTYKSVVNYNGFEYSIEVKDGSSRGGDYDIRIKAVKNTDETIVPVEMPVQISINGVIFNNQIMVEVLPDGSVRFKNQ